MYQGVQVEVSPRGYIKNPTLESEKTTDVVATMSLSSLLKKTVGQPYCGRIVLSMVTTVIGC